MLAKKVWIPILIAVVGCGLFYSQKNANQKPIMTIKPLEAESGHVESQHYFRCPVESTKHLTDYINANCHRRSIGC